MVREPVWNLREPARPPVERPEDRSTDRTGNSADNIIATCSVNLSSETINGNWRLRVDDNSNADTGRIDSWSITF